MRVFPALVCALLACGCLPVRQNTAREAVPESAMPSNRGPAKDSMAPEIPNPGIAKMGMPDVEKSPALDIQPTGRQGWKPEPKPLAELGTRIDQALAGLKEAYAETETIYIFEGNNATAKLDWKIRDADTYRIEWIEPTTMANINSIVRDGNQAALRYGGGAEKARPWPVAPTRASLDLDKFARDPMRSIVGPYESGAKFWHTLLSTMESGNSGFTTARESGEFGVRGTTRKITRVVATSKNGAQIEVVVDDERSLPLTVKTTYTVDGRTDKTLWTAKWATGGKHDDAAFRTPKP